ncbi:MAG: hypothetical protein JSU07_05700 [Bacteroidetes bacterium]|nr:hypothetical protein [Bacteroidota bacterium]
MKALNLIRVYILNFILTLCKGRYSNFFGRRTKQTRALLFWSGGKDSNLSLYYCKRKQIRVVSLVTFKKDLLEHEIKHLQLQSTMLKIPICFLEHLNDLEYIEKLKTIIINYKINLLVSGLKKESSESLL